MTVHQTALPLYDPPPEAPPTDPAPVAHARRTDPATSHAAAASLTPDTLRKSQAEVLNILRHHGPLHDQAIAAAALNWHTKQSTSGLRTRRAELVAAGLVEDSGRRETLPSGRGSVVWRLTERGRNHGR